MTSTAEDALQTFTQALNSFVISASAPPTVSAESSKTAAKSKQPSRVSPSSPEAVSDTDDGGTTSTEFTDPRPAPLRQTQSRLVYAQSQKQVPPPLSSRNRTFSMENLDQSAAALNFEAAATSVSTRPPYSSSVVNNNNNSTNPAYCTFKDIHKMITNLSPSSPRGGGQQPAPSQKISTTQGAATRPVTSPRTSNAAANPNSGSPPSTVPSTSQQQHPQQLQQDLECQFYHQYQHLAGSNNLSPMHGNNNMNHNSNYAMPPSHYSQPPGVSNMNNQNIMHPNGLANNFNTGVNSATQQMRNASAASNIHHARPSSPETPLRAPFANSSAAVTAAQGKNKRPPLKSFIQIQCERLLSADDEDAAEEMIELLFELHLGDTPGNERALQEFIMAGGCDYLVKAMKVHTDNYDIQWKITKLLIPLTYQNDNVVVALLQAGAAKSVLRTMKKFASKEKIQRYGCSVLQNLASPVVPAQTIVVSADGVHVILDAMKSFRRCPSIQMACCNCLALLSFHCESNKKTILQEGGGSALADTQRLFANPESKDEEGVEEAAVVALNTLYSK